MLSTIALEANVNGDMRSMLGALDFAPSAEKIEAIEQLSPTSYKSAGTSSIATQQSIASGMTRQMLSPPVVSSGARSVASNEASGISGKSGKSGKFGESGISGGDERTGVWRGFSSVFGATQRQQKTDDTAGYSADGIGVLGGMERDFDSGLTAGVHLAIQHRTNDSSSADDASVETDSLSVGVHGLLKPEHWDGAYLMAQLRGGMENNSMSRTIDFSGYTRQNTSDWTAWTVGATAGGGYDVNFGTLTAGPVAWFDYSMLARPEFTEEGGGASSLTHEADTLTSLRSNLGARFAVQTAVDSPKYASLVLQFDALSAWQHELMDNYGTSKAGFKGYESLASSYKNEVTERDSMLVELGAQACVNESTTLRVQAGSEFFKEGYSTITSSVSLSWEF